MEPTVNIAANPEQETGMYDLDSKTVKLCEAVFDIAMTAGYMTAKGELPVADDSREAFALILSMAYQFERDNMAGDDYMTAIEAYAAANLPTVFSQLVNTDPVIPNIASAQYVTVWDSGMTVTTSCKVNLKTKEVFDIETLDMPTVEVLEEEFIRFSNGTEEDVYPKDCAEKPEGAYWYN